MGGQSKFTCSCSEVSVASNCATSASSDFDFAASTSAVKDSIFASASFKNIKYTKKCFLELYSYNRHNAAELHRRTNELFFMQNYGVAFSNPEKLQVSDAPRAKI